VWCFHAFEPSAWLTFLTIVVVGGTGVLMVSNVLYRSFKDLDLRGRVPFAAILLVVLIFVVIALDPATVLFTVFLFYALSGPVRALFRKKPRRSAKENK
jgi:CDP-diacylglycerol--serine O-phosphatidyltransferase